MKTMRIILGILAITPLALLADSLFLHPENYGDNSIGEMIYLVVGVSILIFNLWAWVYPEI